MGLSESKFLEKFIASLCSALPTAIINYLAANWWASTHETFDWSKEFILFVAIIEIICILIAYAIVYHILPNWKFMRQFGKYEGRWLEIIIDNSKINNPNNREYSIIDFKFNRNSFKYELKGVNFYKNSDIGVHFEAYKFVERTFKNGFYYITNPTIENKNGLGKISFVDPSEDRLCRAEGYFFDSDNEQYSVKYRTILIKCDRRFCKHIDKQSAFRKMKKLSPAQFMKKCQTFAETELKKHREVINPCMTCTETTRCTNCSCNKKTSEERHDNEK